MKRIFPLIIAALSATTSLNAQNTPAWDKFVNNADDNVLLDFSYAGYDHGKTLPDYESDVNVLANKLGYKIYNVKDYGAIPDDGKSDRAAVEAIINKIGRGKPNAKAIIYFPEGEYILHTEEDDVKDSKTGNMKSETINLVMGHVIIKGAGRDKTFLTMGAPMKTPTPKTLYSSQVMLSIRHNGGGDKTFLANVKSSAKKGDMSIEVDDASKLKVGDWIKLYMKNADNKVINEELCGKKLQASMSNLKSGVEVIDRHQIKSIDDNRITFEEPMHHAVNPDYGWTIISYSHYEESGVEDLTFRGNCKPNFVHHGSWEDDGGYKPLNFMRMVNSWVRRVDFESVSEGMTFAECSNCFMLDSEFSGNRGHSSVRLQNSAHGLIGMVSDHTDGYLTSDTKFENYMENLGQFHACGISKQSIGNVIWRCTWGDDGCFEAHATQPRASLIDYCTGGFMQNRMGGDISQLPNHLDDLIVWNFNCLATSPTDPNPYNWWSTNVWNGWNKILPPTFVGFHGKSINFKESEMKLNENQGKEVLPGSLYEAQLAKRLGYTPQWITDAKNIANGINNILIVKDKKTSKTYGLDGVEVGEGYKGVVVKNGKKVVK